MARKAKITSFEVDAFPVQLPWPVPGNAEIVVFATQKDGVDVDLEDGKDFFVDGQEVQLRCPEGNEDYFDQYTHITLACVPCPEIKIPKFGKVSNHQLQEAFDGLLDRAAYFEARVTEFCNQPKHKDCHCDDDEEETPPVPRTICEIEARKYYWNIQQLIGCWKNRELTCYSYGEFEKPVEFGKSRFDSWYNFVRKGPPLDAETIKNCLHFKRAHIIAATGFERKECGDKEPYESIAFHYFDKQNIRIPHAELSAVECVIKETREVFEDG